MRQTTDDGWGYDELTVIAPTQRPTQEIPRDQLEALKRVCRGAQAHPRLVRR